MLLAQIDKRQEYRSPRRISDQGLQKKTRRKARARKKKILSKKLLENTRKWLEKKF